MGKIIDIDANKPHEVGEVICVKCCNRYISARPLGTKLKDLDCENCGPGFTIITGEYYEEFEE